MIAAAGGHSTQKERHLELADAIQRFRGPLIGLIISWGTPHADAAEIAQDSFSEAWLNRDNCRGAVSDPKVFGAWLRGIAKNTHRNWARSRNPRERRVKLVDSAILDVALNPQEESDHDELTRLRSAIDRLPAKQKEVVLMHYLEETSVIEVAALLSVTPKAIEGRLYQARRALKKMVHLGI